jgi:hypothetical protein
MVQKRNVKKDDHTFFQSLKAVLRNRNYFLRFRFRFRLLISSYPLLENNAWILVIKTLNPDWIRIGIQPKMLDQDPYQMDTDPETLVIIEAFISAKLQNQTRWKT